MVIGAIEQKTNIRFEKTDDFERYINAMDIDYDNEDVIFTGYIYKLNKPQFKIVQRSAYAKGTIYMKEILEYEGQNYYIPTSGMCFIKCINYFSNKDYTEKNQDFIRKEKNRLVLMTSVRIQPICKKYNINIGYFGRTRTNPRTMKQRNISLSIYNIHFIFTWKSSSINFYQAIKELNVNFIVVDNAMSDKRSKFC